MHEISSMLSVFLESSRAIKRSILLALDSIIIIFCLFVALGSSANDLSLLNYRLYALSLVLLLTSIYTFARIGFYRAILRYMGFKSVYTVVLGISFSSVFFALSGIYCGFTVSAIAVFLYWSLCFTFLGGVRLVIISLVHSKSNRSKVPIAIYGAGHAGRELARALSLGSKYKLVAYLDDDFSIVGSEIDGIKVYSPLTMGKVVDQYDVGRVLLAIPSISHIRRSAILDLLEPFPVKVKTIASAEEIVNGKVGVDELKDIDIQDLLGRDGVKPDQELLQSSIKGKIVMVTGAGGSIGSELCRQIIRMNPSAIVLYELNEFALYTIDRELRTHSDSIKVVPMLGSVQHKGRVLKIMCRYSVQTVYHAAAYKHVPMVEHNILEGVKNNVLGTWFAAEAAEEAGVERFVLVSTDKAVRPTNVMGASKRLAELVLQAMHTGGSSTVFSMVRFGNVLGSSGSVVPLFREQIKSGGPITVTHKDIIRYFMTIPEAAQLVIQAGSMGKGGDVFVLDMGDPVKIADLAERMVHLMGLTVKSSTRPQGDIEIEYSGLRPGEKLYEELLIGGNVAGTTHPKIMTANEDFLPWPEMQRYLEVLKGLCDEMNCEGIMELLFKIPTGYNPQHAVCDLLWSAEKNVLRFNRVS